MKSWERIGAITGFEVDQWCEEGCMLDAALLARIESAREANDEELLHELMGELGRLNPADSFLYAEPDDLEAIRAVRESQECRISELASRTHKIAVGVLQEP